MSKSQKRWGEISRCESTRFQPNAARIWFEFVERVTGNHIDERLLTRERTYRRGPCEPRRRFKSRRARQGQRTHDRGTCGRVAAGGGEIRRDLGGFQWPRARRRAEGA